MPAGARLDLTTDTSDIEKGFANTADALDDVVDALDNVGKEGDAVSDELTRSFAASAQETKKEAREMAKGVNSSYDKMEKGSSKANEKMGSSAQSKAREVSASFDGSADSIVSGFQGASAEMFEGFGPAGVAAGLVVAGGIGLITKEFQDAQAEAEELAAVTDSMVGEMLAAGSTYVTEMQKLKAFEAFLGNSSEQKEAQKFADQLGIPLVEFASAMFGLSEDRAIVEQKINDHAADQLATYRELGVTGTDYLLGTKHITDQQKDSLDLLYKQEKAEGLARGVVDAALKIRKDITGEIRETVDVTDELSEEYRKMALQDATPILNIAEEAKRQVREAQRAIDGLTGKTIKINVRVVQ